MNQEKTSREVRLVSPFATKEQERLFAECAKACMNADARLSWNTEEVSEKTSGEVKLVSPFATKEQERLFAECAKACMSPNSRLI